MVYGVSTGYANTQTPPWSTRPNPQVIVCASLTDVNDVAVKDRNTKDGADFTQLLREGKCASVPAQLVDFWWYFDHYQASVPARRWQVAYSRGRGVSVRRACTLFSVARSALDSKPEGDAGCASDRADEGAGGAISAVWLSAHWHLSWTRRIRDEPRASLPAVAGSGSASAAQAAEEACGWRAGRGHKSRRRGGPNQVWSYDFVFDRCANGQQLKCLTVTDEFTKEGLAIDVHGRIRSPRVIEVLSRLISERGAPVLLRSDNGPEFVSKALLSWIAAQGIGTALIEPR
jgi:putative transposase